MANILVNTIKAKTGGGKEILDNTIQMLSKMDSEHHWYFITPSYSAYRKYSSTNIKIIKVNKFYKYNFSFFIMYYMFLPYLMKKLSINLVLNYGDVIIPTNVRQVYYFDWAYAVYNEGYIWINMSLKDYLLRKTKVLLIGWYIQKPNRILVQTKNIARRLEGKYGVSAIDIIPTPIRIEGDSAEIHEKFQLPKDRRLFLVPSAYASHKNLDILIHVAALIEEKSLPFTIVLTLDEDKSTAKLFKKIKVLELSSIITVGKQDNKRMPSLYRQCDVLLLPTLLESYGLPYIEAMAYGLPIVTSDLDFAHDVCGDIAYYFDPFDPDSIIEEMEKVLISDISYAQKIISGKNRISGSLDWEAVLNTIIAIINQEIGLNHE